MPQRSGCNVSFPASETRTISGKSAAAVFSCAVALAIFALVYGVFYGGWVAVLPSVVMDFFGGRNVSGLIGILYTNVAVGTLAGPSAAGFVFDMTHSYTVPIVFGACANAIAAAIFMRTSGPTSPSRPAP